MGANKQTKTGRTRSLKRKSPNQKTKIADRIEFEIFLKERNYGCDAGVLIRSHPSGVARSSSDVGRNRSWQMSARGRRQQRRRRRRGNQTTCSRPIVPWRPGSGYDKIARHRRQRKHCAACLLLFGSPPACSVRSVVRAASLPPRLRGSRRRASVLTDASGAPNSWRLAGESGRDQAQ